MLPLNKAKRSVLNCVPRRHKFLFCIGGISRNAPLFDELDFNECENVLCCYSRIKICIARTFEIGCRIKKYDTYIVALYLLIRSTREGTVSGRVDTRDILVTALLLKIY